MIAEDLTLDHLQRINVREMELNDMGADWLEKNSNQYLSSEYKKAVLNKDGDVVMAMGGKLYGSDAWTWILASELIYKNPVASLEMILRLHEEACTELPYVVRCFTVNDPEFPPAIKFLERIGFKQVRTITGKDGKERILLVKEID